MIKLRRIALCLTLVAAPLLAADKSKERAEPNKGGEIDLRSDDPAAAMKMFTMAPGYEVSLYASEKEFPDLANPGPPPSDARGPMWVATMPGSPQYEPGVPPADKIIVLEDTKHAGKADKCTVFADNLELPTGFELG